jgi:hypothetical protein
VKLGRQLPTFPKNLLPISSKQKYLFYPEDEGSIILRNIEVNSF